MKENKKETINKKVWSIEDVQQLSEAGMMCWIGDSGALCHIMNDDTVLFDIININKLIQSSSSIMPAMKKGKLHVKVWQVNGTEWVHTLCEDCTLGSASQSAISKKAVPQSKTLGERLFFDISSPSTPSFAGKKHWLLIIHDSCNSSGAFLKRKV